MKIIVEKVVNGEKVLVPEVFLASVRAENLTNDGALIVGGDVAIYSKENIENIGTIRADGTVELKGENINNLGGRITGENVKLDADKNITNKGGNIRARVDAILNGENVINEANAKESQYKGLDQKTVGNAGSIRAGQNLSINAEKDIINKGSVLAADKNLDLNAGQNVDIVTVANEKHVGVVCPGSSAKIHSVENQQSVLSGGNVNINAGSDVNIQGGLIAADKDTVIQAGGNVNINAVTDSYSEETQVGSRGGSNYYHDKVVDEKVKGTNIAGKEDISVSAGSDINVKGSSLTSGEGKASLAAGGNVNITNENEYHEKLHESHEKSSGFLSSKTTDIYDYSNVNGVVSSNVSAGSVDIQSGKDTNVKGSNVVADNDVSVKAGGNLNIGSAEQTSESEYRKSVKKSGVFAGGGLGFTIGKEKQKDQYANQNTEQVGSTVGSVKGNVNLDADKAANVKGSTVVAGKDINITGENISIENSNSVYNAQEKHEFKRTGLSVSVGGGYVDVVNNAANSVKHATEVEDKRLGALVAIKGYKDADKAIKNIKSNGGGKVNENMSINVSLGTMKSKSESKSTTTVANASEVKAGVDVNVTSTKKDINITGSNVEGKDVTLNAKENLNITASKNTNKLEQNSKSSSASVGASLELGKGPSYSISGSMSKGEVSANGTTYNESTVKADKNLDFTSGKDTNIKGGELSGEKVTGSVGGDLNVESKQDSNSYKEKNKSVGASVGFGSNKVVSGSASVGKIDSKYESVTDQSGIYAGKEGFEINVEANTDLKGGIISSTADADKNKLSTGTLTFDDIQNKADYKANGIGAKVNKNNNADYNEKGITPDIGMPASGEAESTTKATISKGTIEIRDKENQKQDINKLNRDTANSLNKLGEIFDKTKVEERQELANLFGELAYNEIHYMDGSNEQKALYHAVVGGIMSKLTGGDFLAGATAAGINKLVIEEVKKAANYEPDKMQWVSAALGAVVAEFVSGNAQAGASAAASGTKNNEVADIIFNPKRVLNGYGEGLKDRGIEEIEDISAIVSDPLGTLNEMYQFLQAVYEEPSLANEIKEQFVDVFNERLDKFENGTPEETGYELGRISVDIASLCVASGSSKILTKFPRVGKIVSSLEKYTAKSISTTKLTNDIVYIGDSLWEKGAFKRGQIIDKALGNNLGYNFPVVDKLNDRTITSIKSMDLNANTYQTGRGIYNALVKNIDDLEAFEKRSWRHTTINIDDYDYKQLEVAIPKITISKDQKNGLEQAVKYAKSKNINVKITVVE